MKNPLLKKRFSLYTIIFQARLFSIVYIWDTLKISQYVLEQKKISQHSFITQ